MHCCESEQRVLDGIVGKNNHRVFRRKTAREQGRGDGINLRARLGPRHLPPAAAFALGEKDIVRFFRCPAFQVFAEAPRVRF